jgi:hypothetical protein
MSDRVQRHGYTLAYKRTLNVFLHADNRGGVGIGISTNQSEINDLIVRLTPEDLAEALNELDGFTVRYKKPVHVPTGVGAVVKYAGILWVFNGSEWSTKAGEFAMGQRIEQAIREGAEILSEGVDV